ncbi:hypothetical protein [Marinicrinis lubricantis]|uniref:Uncharacterized protein n=1 Tax=Marinicrinis lubricantis TaxID=2086470 RepID=A0ABW1ITX7_9BACL
MKTRLEQLAEQIPDKNQDIIMYAKHVFKALEDFENHHRRFTAALALSGSSPVGEQEQLFYQTIQDIRNQMLQTLEYTVEDLQHKGDKNYSKHFTDGVE